MVCLKNECEFYHVAESAHKCRCVVWETHPQQFVLQRLMYRAQYTSLFSTCDSGEVGGFALLVL